MYFTVLEYDD
jgi:thioredoxin-like negative regulator of GroEL